MSLYLWQSPKVQTDRSAGLGVPGSLLQQQGWAKRSRLSLERTSAMPASSRTSTRCGCQFGFPLKRHGRSLQSSKLSKNNFQGYQTSAKSILLPPRLCMKPSLSRSEAAPARPHPPCSFSFMLLVAAEGGSMLSVSQRDNVCALLP